MAQQYTYDPSAQIKQSFKEAESSIGNVFTNIIEQKQRDYKLSENVFQNVEALKKNLNLFGQKSITEKSNQLLKEASSAIYENGKLDYTKLGEIRQKISDIGDLKQGYDLGAKEYERMLQLGVANKDNLVSFEKFYKDLSSKMGDENLVKNPQDLQRSMAEAYTDNLNVDKMFQKSFTAVQPYQDITKEIINPKGDKLKVEGKLPVNWNINEKGDVVMPPTQVASTLEYLKQNNPDLLAMMKKKAGVGGEIAGDEGVVQYYLDKIPAPRKVQTIATKEKQDTEAAQADIAQFKAKHQGEMFNLEKQLKLSSISANNAKKQKYLKDTYKDVPMPTDLAGYGINANENGKSVDFGAEIPIRAFSQKDGKEIKAKAVALRTLPNGKQQVLAYPATSGIVQSTGELIYGKTPIYFDYNKPTVKNSLTMGIKNLGKDKEGNISQSIAVYNRIPVSSSKSTRQEQVPIQQSEAPNKPQASSNTKSVSESEAKAFAKANNYDYEKEYKPFLVSQGFKINK